MIEYEEDWLFKLLFQREGSVGFRALLFALPAAAFAVLLNLFDDRVDLLSSIGVDDIKASQVWTATAAVLSALLAFRTSQGLARFWEGTSLLHQMRGEWFDSVSCCVTFSRRALEKQPREVKTFRHTIVRLMSLCHCSALKEIAAGEDTTKIMALDVKGLDLTTILHLRECKQEYGFNTVEGILHLVQVLMTKALEDKILEIPPPILSRVYQTLSRGFVNLLNAKKITDTRFPFPYAQLIAILLITHLFLTPILLAALVPNTAFIAILTFVAIFGEFSLNFVAIELENPFGSDDNDLPLERFQKEMNSSLLMLLHVHTDHVPYPSKKCVKDFEALRHGGWLLRKSSICSAAQSERSSDLPTPGFSSEEPDYWMPGSEDLATPGPLAFGDMPSSALGLGVPRAAEAVPDPPPVTMTELEPKMELLSKRVEEFGLVLPHWAQMVETQVLELSHSFKAMQELAVPEGKGDQGALDKTVIDSLKRFPTL